MKSTRFTIEHTLYAVAILIALGVRLVNLGVTPLALEEASWGLQAFGVSQGGQPTLGSQPGYVLPTGALFFLFGSSTFLARLFPALLGSMLVFYPFIYRERLGKKTALILAFGLALDPGLIALSRQANGGILAVSFGLLACTAWYARKPVLVGIAAGLAFLAGPLALAGMAGGGLAWLLWRYVFRHWGNAYIGEQEPEVILEGIPTGFIRVGLLTGGGTLLLAGTLFLRFPQGLGALAGALPDYLQGWTNASGVPSLRLVAALLFYHPLPLLFGLIGGVRAWGQRSVSPRILGVWFLVAFAIALLYPARTVSDLVWALVPLWTLAALELARYFRGHDEFLGTSLGQAAVIFIFLSYVWLNVATVARVANDPQMQLLRWELIGGALVLILITTVLIGLGWSRETALNGLVWGFCLGLGVFSISTAWKMVAMDATRVQEWWYPQPSTVQEKLLQTTIGDISEWHTGRRDDIEILVTEDLPSFRWSLRQFPNVRYGGQFSSAELPALVITPQEIEPRLAATYRGTDFLWSDKPVWSGVLPADVLLWLVSRESPTQSDQVILWARNDLFLDGVLRLPEEVEEP
jgi:hypothetical protein